MNKSIMMGRLVRDPEVNYTTKKDGDEFIVANFRIAVDRKYSDETDFFPCTAFGWLAEFVEKYLCEIGKYTLVLYLVPILILPPRTFTVDSQLTFTTVNLIILAIAVLHSVVSYVIGRIVYEIPYLRFILFGKK